MKAEAQSTHGVPAGDPRQSRRVLYNFDGFSCMFTKAGGKGPVPVTVEDVRRLIEEVAYPDSRVDTVLVCINAQVMFYPTKVGTMLGAPPSEIDPQNIALNQLTANLKAFYDAGVDPYAVMVEETKKRGREVLLSFRMNDDHRVEFQNTRFLAEHPECRLGAKGLNFGYDEVREHIFRLIEEAMQRYDSDGIELDFNRFPRFFEGIPTEERVEKMNSLVERVRKMVDAVGAGRKRRLVLTVRVPSNYNRTPPTPETALATGCDVPEWVRRGWVDFVTVSEFLNERGDLPVAEWKRAIPTVPVCFGIECIWGDAKRLSPDDYRASAAKLVESGADGVYIFNFFTTREQNENSFEPPFEVLKEIGRER